MLADHLILTWPFFFNHIKFSINLKIRKEHICAYNACTIQYSTNDLEECVTHSYGGSYLWTATFKKVVAVCFCELQNRWLWWFLKFLRGNLFFYVFLFRNMNTLCLQEFAAEAVAMNRIFSEASAIDEPGAHYDEFQNNIKPRLFGLSPPSNSVLARRRAASSKSHLQNPVNRDVEKSGL